MAVQGPGHPPRRQPRHRASSQATTWQVWVWWASAPMLLLVPLWFVLGRLVMGAVGVLTGVAVITVVPVLLLLQLVALVPVLLRGARVSPAAAGRRTTACSLSYWGCVLLPGVSMGDLRDTSRPAVSAPLVSLGIPVELANLVAILAAVGGAISLIVLVVVAWIELCRLPPTVQGPPFPTGKDGP